MIHMDENKGDDLPSNETTARQQRAAASRPRCGSTEVKLRRNKPGVLVPAQNVSKAATSPARSPNGQFRRR